MKNKLHFGRIIATLLLFAVSTLSWGYDFVVDGIYYNKNSDGTSVTVTSKDKYGNSYSGEIVIPKTVNNGNTTYTVTSIGDYAFEYSSGLISITIPNSVTSIGNSSFENCSGLISVAIPNSVTSIGSTPFENCSSLTSITIPNSVKSFGNGMLFRDCTGKLYFDCDIPDDNDWFKWSKFSEIVIGDNVQSIGRNAFSNCTTNISSVIIGNNVTSIGEYAFYGCSNLTSVTIGNNVQTIEGGAFSGCNLTSVNLPESLTSIGGSAFADCPLSTITIHKNIKAIGGYAFNARHVIINSNDIASKEYSTSFNLLTCFSRAEEFVFGDNVASIGSYAFASESSTKYFASVVIGKNVKNIGVGAFNNCNTLEKAEFSSIESLCNISFNNGTISAENGKSNPLYYAKHLYVDGQEIKNVNIPNSITSIGKYTFYGCSYIESITIPEGVTSIGERAFSDCYNLSTLICLAENIPATEASSFYGYAPARATLYVPASFVDAYNEADNWKSFGSILTLEDKEAGIAAKGICGDNLNYVLSTDSTLTISGTGQMTAAKWSDFKNRVKTVVIEYGVTNVIGSAFKGYSNLTSISIPESVVSIGKQAFYNCENLYSVICAAIDVPTTGTNVFLDVPQSSATLYVPASSVDAYKAAAQWKNFGTILPIADEPIYVDVDVTANVPTDWQGWTGATGYTSTQFAPMVTTNDGREVQVCERFNKNSATTGTVFYRTLTGLTNGTYRIELYGAAASTKGRDTAIDSDMTEEDEGDETAVYLYAMTASGMEYQFIPVHWATSFSEVATGVLNNVEVTDGMIEIGMYSQKKFTNWHVVQIKGVTAHVDAEEYHADVLAKAQTDLNDEAYVNIIGEERTALEQAVSQYATVSEHTAEAYKTAIDAIVAASSTFEKALPSYEIWADIARRSYPYASAEKKAAAESAAAQLPTTAADAESKREALIPLYRIYAESSALLEGVDGSENVTDLYIENPRAETGYSATGWQVTWGEGSPVGAISIKTAEPWTDANGSTDHRYFDGGYWGAQSWDATQQQEVTLPAGHYQLTVMGRSSSDVEQTLFAGEESAEMPHIGAAGGLFNRGWEQTSLEFELTETTTLNVGVRGVTNYRYNWMSFSDFRLVRFPGGTGVDSLQAEDDKIVSNAPIYDLNGRKLTEKPKSGYYIQNGKKYFVE